MVLGQKWQFFELLFFRQYRTRKCLLRYSREKKRLFYARKTTSSKSKQIDIFSKRVNPWFWSQNGQFSNFSFLGNIGQENVFYDIVEQKNAFLGYKNKKFKKSKN